MNDTGMNLLQDTVVTDKVVFVRCDFNVPVKNERIIDDSRIMYAIDTINYLVRNNAKVVIGTHLGRPNGKYDSKLSTKIIADYLNNFTRGAVYHVSESAGPIVESAIKKMRYGDILVLENLRFHPEEEACDLTFAKQLSNSCNIYVNEAFSCSHRSHASILGVPLFIKCVAGFRLQEELKALKSVTYQIKKPALAIIGGSKISTKIEIILSLIEKMDYLFLAGGMANTFLAQDGYQVGQSFREENCFGVVKEIKMKASKLDCQIIIPDEFQVGDHQGRDPKIKKLANINSEDSIFDISPNFIETKMKEILGSVSTVLWNGPLGMFEVAPYHEGSVKMAEIIAEATKKGKLKSIAGGGDVLAAINKAEQAENFSFVSTAGGAFLEFIEGRTLPGIEILHRMYPIYKHD